MKGEARKHWFAIVPALLARRTLSEADHGHLEGMCCWWGAFVKASADVEKITPAKPYKGHLIDHPRVVMTQAWKAYSQAAQQFGLSPASKARVQASPEEKKPPAKPQASGLRIAE